MPMDVPVYPGYQKVPLAAETITSSGCTSAALALDDDPATSAIFGAADMVGAVAPTQQSTIPHNQFVSGTFDVIAGQASAAPRYLRIQFAQPHRIARVRLAMTDAAMGANQANLRVAFTTAANPFDLLTAGLASGDITSLLTGGLSGASGAEVPMSYLPLWMDGTTHLIVLDIPVLATGVVIYPDAGADAATVAGWSAANYPTINVSQFQLFEPTSSGGNQTMPLPVNRRARVGVQDCRVFPWNGAAGPYDNTTAEVFAGLQELGLSISSKSAVVTGGETVHKLAAFETERETKIKFTVEKCTLRVLQVLLGGGLTVVAKNMNGGEVVIWTQDLLGRAGYFRLEGKSTNGEGADKLIYPKVKLDGSVTYNLSMGEVTKLEVEGTIFWDDTYTTQTGALGAVSEFIYAEDGNTTIHA